MMFAKGSFHISFSSSFTLVLLLDLYVTVHKQTRKYESTQNISNQVGLGGFGSLLITSQFRLTIHTLSITIDGVGNEIVQTFPAKW
jgi:hypothetical protein